MKSPSRILTGPTESDDKMKTDSTSAEAAQPISEVCEAPLTGKVCGHCGSQNPTRGKFCCEACRKADRAQRHKALNPHPLHADAQHRLAWEMIVSVLDSLGYDALAGTLRGHPSFVACARGPEGWIKKITVNWCIGQRLTSGKLQYRAKHGADVQAIVCFGAGGPTVTFKPDIPRLNETPLPEKEKP